MSTEHIGPYAKDIKRLLHCTRDEAVMVEDIMRNEILHTVALDWLSAREFSLAVGKAAHLFARHRAMYEKHYADAKAAFAEMRASRLENA